MSVCSKLHTMLFYNKITESEGLNRTVGINVNCTGVGSSKQCDIYTSTFSKKET